MASYNFIWTDGVIAKLALFDLSTDEVEEIVCHPMTNAASRSSGLPGAFGYAADGRYVFVVYELIDPNFDTVQVFSAYPVPEP